MAINETEDFIYSPYVALMVDKDAQGIRALAKHFSQQSASVKEIIASPKTAEGIKTLLESRHVDEVYALAIAKIVGYVALGEIPVSQIAALLKKLEVPESDILAPEIERIATKPTEAPPAPSPEKLTEVSPLRVTTPANAEPQGPNVINLRR